MPCSPSRCCCRCSPPRPRRRSSRSTTTGASGASSAGSPASSCRARGAGSCAAVLNEGGRITELEITSPEAGRGEFFRYGGELRADGTTAQAWSSYRWRGQEKSHRDPVAEEGVVDVASGIHLIRARRPTSPLRLRIWSDGRVYPVVVQRAGTERVAVPAGSFLADHYRIRGVRTAGERFWKGGLDLWLAKDDAATPVRIQVERGFANVRLDLLPGA